jgi:PAS domain S-box-containing protein
MTPPIRSEGSGIILPWPLWLQYLMVVAAVAVLTLVRLALDPVLGWRAPFMFYLIGLFIIALAVRPGPYIVASVLALATADLLFIEPRGSLFGASDANLQVAIYALAAALVPIAAWPARAAHQRVVHDRERIIQSEQRFRLALAHSQVVVYTTDLDLRATWIYNPHPHFNPETVVGKSADELMPGGDGSEVMALQREVLQTGKPQRKMVPVIIDGQRVFYDLSAEPLLDSEGRITGIAAAASDITSQVQIEEELRTAQLQASQLWRQCEIACEAGGMGEWSWDIGTDRITWSTAMHRVMGSRPMPSPAGRAIPLSPEHTLQYVHPADRERIREMNRRLLAEGDVYSVEFRLQEPCAGKTDHERWIETRGRIERDALGKAVSITGVALDVTARRLVEEALSHQNADLIRSNVDLEDFAHIVSHDFKEPLRGIKHYTAFILEDDGLKLSAESRAKLETIQRLTARLTSLLDALLQYSRVGRADFGVMECCLHEVATAAIQRLDPWLEECGATVEFDSRLPRVRCDVVRVEEVFTNLISNAVKYNDSPRKEVRLGVHGDGAVYVRDNGIGIPARSIDDIFRMLRRLHASDAYGGGTGSGLALARKIVERHGGRIWVESEPGRGSTFSFTLGPSSAIATTATDALTECACMSRAGGFATAP